jgi:hypothetical protein
MGPRRPTGITQVTHHVTPLHPISGLYCGTGEVGVKGGIAVAVVKLDMVTIAAVILRLEHRTISGG